MRYIDVKPIGIWCFFVSIILFALAFCNPAGADEPTRRSLPKAVDFDAELPWINVTRPLRMEDLRGKVVILDFWTYGCINCIHVLDDLNRLEHKYGDRLAVIGVHSPKFDNEKEIEAVRRIVVRYAIQHPVVHDKDFGLATSYGMRAWPTQIVIVPDGGVLGKVVGEGNYELFEEVIDKLLEEYADIIDTRPLPLALEKAQTESLLAAPGKIAVSGEHVAISDTLHHRILITDHEGRIQSIYGGDLAGFSDGDASEARFSSPQGMAFGDNGVYVADTGNHAIRHIDFTSQIVTTVAGNGSNEFLRSGEFDATGIGLRSPWALARLGSDLYIAMAGMHQIWKLDLAREKIGPYAGSGREGIDDGPLTRATFSQPSGLSIMGKWLYVADSEDSAVRRIHLRDGKVETLVGEGLFEFGDKDGRFSSARLQHVLGIAALDDNTVFIADTYNHKLKKLRLRKSMVNTTAGTGKAGNALGGARQAELDEPGRLAILGHKILIADTNNNRIAQYDPETEKLTEWPLTESD